MANGKTRKKITLAQATEALLNSQEFEANRQEANARRYVNEALERLTSAATAMNAGTTDLRHDTQWDVKLTLDKLNDAMVAISQVNRHKEEAAKLRTAIRSAE